MAGTLRLTPNACKCPECSHLWWPNPPFLYGRHRYVRSYDLTVRGLLKFGTFVAIAEHLQVVWDQVTEIDKKKLPLLYGSIPLHKVKYTGIDEFSPPKGHECMPVVTDIESGRVLHAVDGKSREDTARFLKSSPGSLKDSGPWPWTCVNLLQRQAYGFRDMEYFKLRLYHLHTQRYSLSG